MKRHILAILFCLLLLGCETGISRLGLETGTTGVPGGAAPTSGFATLSTAVPNGEVVLSSVNFTVLVSSPFFPIGSIAGNGFSSSDPLLELGDDVIEAFGE